MDKELNKLVAGIKDRVDRRTLHPEDEALEREGWIEGETYAPDFCRDHFEWFVQMIAVYPDAGAQEVLEALREKFWSSNWPPIEDPKP